MLLLDVLWQSFQYPGVEHGLAGGYAMGGLPNQKLLNELDELGIFAFVEDHLYGARAGFPDPPLAVGFDSGQFALKKFV